MPRRLSIGLAVAALLTSGFMQSSKPERREFRHIDYHGQPILTFSQLANASDVVAIGTVGDKTYTPSQIFTVDTRYQFLPHEVLKSDAHSSVNLSWQIVDHGGKIEEASAVRIVEFENAPTLRPGKKYVLFLRWVEELDAYMIVLGADGVVQIMENETIAMSGKMPLSKQATGTTLSMLRKAIPPSRH